jgi:uncharacterized membrane protein YqgA involved in biofilm formation
VVVGTGTALNVATVLLGSGLGLLLGHRLTQRTRDVVTDGLGLVTLLVAALSTASVLDPALRDAVGGSAPVLVVLGSLLVGGVVGSLLRVEDGLRALGGVLQRRLGSRRGGEVPDRGEPDDGGRRERFVHGFLTASLVFCVGPLTILGSLSDGLGRGIDQLALKSVLDGFASIAFAATLGVGVMASAVTVAVVQGSFTLAGMALGGTLPAAHIAALTATGGLLLVGVSLRLLRVRDVPVGDLLPALVMAPVLVEVIVRLR